jgi:hypothetical protein
MTNWGAVSSWIAAAISAGAFGGTTARAWWYKPMVDWSWPDPGWLSQVDQFSGSGQSLSGLMKAPQGRPNWLEGQATIANFGDGIAHRVAVHVRRGDAPQSQVLKTSPLMQSGDTLDFTVGCSNQHWDTTVVWVTWTPPPIRRRRERTSKQFLTAEHLEQSDLMRQRMAGLREKSGD